MVAGRGGTQFLFLFSGVGGADATQWPPEKKGRSRFFESDGIPYASLFSSLLRTRRRRGQYGQEWEEWILVGSGRRSTNFVGL